MFWNWAMAAPGVEPQSQCRTIRMRITASRSTAACSCAPRKSAACKWDFPFAMTTSQCRVRRSPKPSPHLTSSSITANTRFSTKACWCAMSNLPGPVFTTSAFYTQWSRAFGRYRPYFRYEYFNAPSDDPVYMYASANEYAPLAVTGFIGRLNGASLGIRYDATENVALKFQYDRFSMRDLATENGLTLQFAFTF